MSPCIIWYFISEKDIGMTKNKKTRASALPPCPRKEVIQAMQFQFFDNGLNHGRGRSQHTMALEVYCDGRLNLYRPYWKRAVQLLTPNLVRRWADKKLAAGEMTAEQHAEYAVVCDTCESLAQDPDMEFAKIGHIEDRRSKTRYIGQFIMVTREKAGPIQCHVALNGEVISAERFLHDQRSKPGTGRRKAFGWWDPSGLYDLAKREEAMKAEATALEARGLVADADVL
jgi:hypothetical protein